jgi:hypothetical protein
MSATKTMPAATVVSPAGQTGASTHRVDLSDGRVMVVRIHCEDLPADQESFQVAAIRPATYEETIIALRSLLPAGIQ